MCGLTGIIFGKKKRNKNEIQDLLETFTSAFIFSEERGKDASGVVTVDTEGKSTLYKLPVPPSRLFVTEGYKKVLDSVSNKTTILMGHSRWKTVGSQYENKNNQPLIVGDIVGSHNGTIRNADYLFRSLGLKRHAKVDSEILFRMAEESTNKGVLNIDAYKSYLSKCVGSLACVFVSRLDPQNVFIFKGDKPLSLFFSKKHKAMIYSSERRYIEESVLESEDWVQISMENYRMYQTNFSDFTSVITDTFSTKRVAPITILEDKGK